MTDSNLTADDFRNWRRRMKWTRDYAAQRLGLSYSTVHNYETGRRADRAKCGVPVVCALAMAAVESGIRPLGGYVKK